MHRPGPRKDVLERGVQHHDAAERGHPAQRQPAVRVAPQQQCDQSAHGREQLRVAQVREPAEAHERAPRHVGGDGVGQRLVGAAHGAAVAQVRGDPRDQHRRREDQHEAQAQAERQARFVRLAGVGQRMAPLQHPAGEAGAEHRHGQREREPGQGVFAQLLCKKNQGG
ncbi:hypothetical protein D3C71_996020 [compost metagenome]